ncbi:hypothetical protein IWQ60_008552 [Tieghemiomyces parasiticus]|uniref:Cullin-5 n=1 Tax=Tieghemiomyces parasiticus TaxID=78921 RepID=A0A9W8DLF3_9FUNG|nr:hypothetical protein IWQ60_008552 [Tieghemiomyces parasiticus]
MLLLNRKRVPFESMWAELSQVLTRIYTFTDVEGVSGVEVMQLVYDMCTARPTPYTRELLAALTRYLEDHVNRTLVHIVHNSNPLRAYGLHWNKYQRASAHTDSLCIYLNKQLRIQAQRTTPDDPWAALNLAAVDPPQSSVAAVAAQADSISLADIAADGEPRLPSATYPSGITRSPPSVLTLAYRAWRDRLLAVVRTQYQNVLIKQVFDIITTGRQGGPADHALVHDFVDTLCAMKPPPDRADSSYQTEFKEPYLARLRQFTERRGRELYESLSVTAFMRQVEALLQEETVNAERYCHPNTANEVAACCEQTLIIPYVARLQTELDAAIVAEHLTKCTLAYQLLARVSDGIGAALRTYEKHVITAGRAVWRAVPSTEFKDLRSAVEWLMDLHSQHVTICQDVFKQDRLFVAALDKAFRAIINYSLGRDVSAPIVTDTGNPTSSGTGRLPHAPELLARYADVVLLRKSARATTLTDADRERRLHQLINLFRYLDDKDVFQTAYTRLLAKRLLFDQSVSLDTEMTVVSRLRDLCGAEYTGHLQQMFNDLTVSQGLTEEFSVASPEPWRLDVRVLTVRAWPLTAGPAAPVLPTGLDTSLRQFTELYHRKHSGRKLQWLWQFTGGDLELHYLDKRYRIRLSLYQLALLLQFKSDDRHTIQQLAQAAGLSAAEVTQNLRPVVDLGLLVTMDPAASWKPTTLLTLNLRFSSKRTRLRVSTTNPTASESATVEPDPGRASLGEDRKLYLQALIVRIMKTRHRLPHTALLNEVIQEAQPRFRPDVVLVKKSIEQLLNKEYLERDPANRDVYIYVA